MTDMKEMIKKYAEMTEELKAYGKIIINTASEKDWDNFNSLIEIENMDMQFDCCTSIFEKEI